MDITKHFHAEKELKLAATQLKVEDQSMYSQDL